MPFSRPGKETTVDTDYEWMNSTKPLYSETNSELLPERIESAQNAIGQRVITVAIDEAERRAITKTLNALAILKRERRPARICGECFDPRDVVTSLNGQTFLVKTAVREVAVALHTRCVVDWADRNNCQALAPLRRARAVG
jgi:hypothetical protein